MIDIRRPCSEVANELTAVLSSSPYQDRVADVRMLNQSVLYPLLHCSQDCIRLADPDTDQGRSNGPFLIRKTKDNTHCFTACPVEGGQSGGQHHWQPAYPQTVNCRQNCMPPFHAGLFTWHTRATPHRPAQLVVNTEHLACAYIYPHNV